jgi:hypothetical protein
MKKLLNVIILGLSLALIEYFFMLVCYLAEGFIFCNVPLVIIEIAFRQASEVCIVKFIFYFIFWVFVMIGIYCEIKIRPSLKLSIINCGLYILLSIFYAIVLPFTRDYFLATFFYFFVLATFLSPTILITIPYYQKTLDSIDCQ